MTTLALSVLHQSAKSRRKLLATWNAAYTDSIWNPCPLPLDLLFMLYLDDPVSLDTRIPNALLSLAVLRYFHPLLLLN